MPHVKLVSLLLPSSVSENVAIEPLLTVGHPLLRPGPSARVKGRTSEYALELSPSALLLPCSALCLSLCRSAPQLAAHFRSCPLHPVLCPSDVAAVSSSYAASLDSRVIYKHFSQILEAYLICLTHFCFPRTYTLPDT